MGKWLRLVIRSFSKGCLPWNCARHGKVGPDWQWLAGCNEEAQAAGTSRVATRADATRQGTAQSCMQEEKTALAANQLLRSNANAQDALHVMTLRFTGE